MGQVLCARCKMPVRNIPQWLANARMSFICQQCRDASQAASWELYKQKVGAIQSHTIEKPLWDDISFEVLDELLRR